MVLRYPQLAQVHILQFALKFLQYQSLLWHLLIPLQDTRVGDTITLANNPASEPLEGYRQMNPMVYCGLYPIDTSRYNDLREALEKLQLNDAALQFEPETSQALGFGFRCGFLGLLLICDVNSNFNHL